MRRIQIPEDVQPLPTDGLEVHEVRDEDTVRLFRRAWRERLIREAQQAPLPADRTGHAVTPVRAA